MSKKTVKMVHETTGKEADVHPDMIDHYQAGGFQRKEPPQSSTKSSSKKSS